MLAAARRDFIAALMREAEPLGLRASMWASSLERGIKNMSLLQELPKRPASRNRCVFEVLLFSSAHAKMARAATHANAAAGEFQIRKRSLC
jgi:hypothetical protein